MKKSNFNKTTIWALLLFLVGFLALVVQQGIPAIVCFNIGAVMLIEQRWPEKWGEEEQNGTDE